MPTSIITPNQPIEKPPPSATHRSWWRASIELFCFTLISLVLLEAYFRAAGVGCGEFLKPDLHLGTSHIPDKQVIWRAEGFSNNKINSAGLRDNEHKILKPSSVYRIAILGDSFVEALQVDLKDTFPKVLEAKLNSSYPNKKYETLNFGCGGYSTAQEYIQYQIEDSQYKPDAIILVYNRGDSMESVIANKARKRAEPRPYFYLDKAGNLEEDDSVLESNTDKLKPNLIWDWLRKNSTIFSVINQSDFSLTLNEPYYRKIKGWLISLWQKTIGQLVSANSGHSKVQSNITKSYPDQDEMLVTKALIAKLSKQAASNGQKFILVIYPNLDHYDQLTAQAAQLKALAEQNHFQYLDLSPAFLADKEPRSNFALYHLNKKGHITVANQLFNYLIKQ